MNLFNLKNNKKDIETANDLVDVIDITRKKIYTKSGYTIGFVRLYPINIDLLTNNEIASLCNTLTAKFKPEKEPFIIYSIPRTVDMEQYINYLTNQYDNEMSNAKRKMLLNIMISEATDKVLSGQNFEHQFYVKVWEKTDSKNSDKKIEERLDDISMRFESVQNMTKRIDDTDTIKLCNLFGNSNTATMETYDENSHYTPISFIEKR